LSSGYNKDKKRFEVIDGNFTYPISEELAEDFPRFNEYKYWLKDEEELEEVENR
jgi:hypothetical protein